MGIIEQIQGAIERGRASFVKEEYVIVWHPDAAWQLEDQFDMERGTLKHGDVIGGFRVHFQKELPSF